jgi:hypothetical protein
MAFKQVFFHFYSLNDRNTNVSLGLKNKSCRSWDSKRTVESDNGIRFSPEVSLQTLLNNRPVLRKRDVLGGSVSGSISQQEYSI